MDLLVLMDTFRPTLWEVVMLFCSQGELSYFVISNKLSDWLWLVLLPNEMESSKENYTRQNQYACDQLEGHNRYTFML